MTRQPCQPGPLAMAIREPLCWAAAVCVAFVLALTGCMKPAFEGDPVRRTQRLIFTEEDKQELLDEWAEHETAASGEQEGSAHPKSESPAANGETSAAEVIDDTPDNSLNTEP